MDSLVEFEYLGADRAIAVARMVREKPLNRLLLGPVLVGKLNEYCPLILLCHYDIEQVQGYSIT